MFCGCHVFVTKSLNLFDHFRNCSGQLSVVGVLDHMSRSQGFNHACDLASIVVMAPLILGLHSIFVSMKSELNLNCMLAIPIQKFDLIVYWNTKV